MMTATPIGGTWKWHRVALVDAIVGVQLGLRLEGVYLDTSAYEPDPATVDVWIANHTSRYDGFLIWKAKHALNPSGRLFTVMLSSSLARHRVFDGAGAVGISPGSAASIRSVIRFVESVPERGDGLVIFPQGKIYAGDKRPVNFRSIARLAEHTGPPARYIPCAIAVEMLNRRRPTAFMRIGPSIAASGGETHRTAESAVDDMIGSLRDDLSRHGESLPGIWNDLHSGARSYATI